MMLSLADKAIVLLLLGVVVGVTGFTLPTTSVRTATVATSRKQWMPHQIPVQHSSFRCHSVSTLLYMSDESSEEESSSSSSETGESVDKEEVASTTPFEATTNKPPSATEATKPDDEVDPLFAAAAVLAGLLASFVLLYYELQQARFLKF